MRVAQPMVMRGWMTMIPWLDAWLDEDETARIRIEHADAKNNSLDVRVTQRMVSIIDGYDEDETVVG